MPTERWNGFETAYRQQEKHKLGNKFPSAQNLYLLLMIVRENQRI